MSVYVDNYRVTAKVGNVQGRWSHLTADTTDELHAFAARIGMRRSWFQGRCKSKTCTTRADGVCVHYHYDVVDSRRQAAIAAGAEAVTLKALGQIISARRAAWREQEAT